MIFSYDSTYYGQTAIAQRLSLIAEQLLRELISSRSQCRRRPILFVGHCFGGIVIEKALVLAKLRIEEYGMILQSTAGAVFLGTPHRGTAAQTLVRQVLVILSIFRRVEPGLLQLLRLNSESLRDLLYDFTLMVHEVDIPLFCFFEQHPTDIMRAMRYGLLIPAYLPLPQWPVSPVLP
jgi:hypothetical protein